MYHRTIYMASDHGGFELKASLLSALSREGYEVKDLGPLAYDPDDDYPDYVARLCRKVLEDRSLGIMLCKSGAGVSIAANKFKGIYAALCWNEETAMRARKDENANVLCMGALFVSPQLAERMVKAWLNQPFEEGRHARRLNKIKMIEEGLFK